MQIQTIPLWPDRSDAELTTFLSMPDPFIPVLPPRPAVIVCPGGAYMSCPRHGTEGDPIAMAFACAGYQAFVLEYSVAGRAPLGKALFPAQLLDFGKAILTIRERAAEWSVDADKISVIGFSAGGHLCGMLASTWQQSLLAEHFGVPAETFRPLTAMLIYPFADYAAQLEMELQGTDRPLTGADALARMFGCANPDAETLRRYSPARQVSAHTPPLFIAAAQDDELVTPLNSLRLAEACQTHGVPYELHLYERGSHGFGSGRNLLRPWRADRAHDCQSWFGDALRFLFRHAEPQITAHNATPLAELQEWAAQW